MRGIDTKLPFYIVFLFISTISATTVILANKTAHHGRRSSEALQNVKFPSYRSYQPVQIKYHKPVYPKPEEHNDYDISSYDTEYGGVVSNFTSSIYEDNPSLYPNPDTMVKSNQVLAGMEEREPEEMPDDSLADGDLKDHNIIDSVTYLYGFNSCPGAKSQWMILIFIGSGMSIALISSTLMWLTWSEYTREFRARSRLYAPCVHLCCCLEACTLLYVQAAVGVSGARCEALAILLHYAHLASALWVLLVAACVAEFSRRRAALGCGYLCLAAYGVPAVVVLFNYALSMEHYETRLYCWMSLEKGMMLGFMAPATLLILANTAVVIVGLQSVHRRRASLLSSRLAALARAAEPGPEDCGCGGDECADAGCQAIEANMITTKIFSDKNLLHLMFLDNISLKSSVATETDQLKRYLHLCLVLEPFFAVNWVLGVLAVENAAHWPTPALYLVTLQAMYVYLAATVCSTLPMVAPDPPEDVCEEVIAEPAVLVRTRTTDSIPLLDPAIQNVNFTHAPADTISTISI